MKAVLISDHSSFGGAKEFILNLLWLLQRKNIEIILYLTKEQDTEEIRSICHQSVKIVQFIYKNNDKPSSFLNTVINDLTSLKNVFITGSETLIISSTVPGKYLALSLFFKNTYYFLHTVPEIRMSLIPRLILNSPLARGLRVITVSKYSSDKIAKFWGRGAKIIPNGVKKAPRTFNRKNKKAVLTMGHVTDYKNPETWLEVAKGIIKKHPDIKFVWCGDGDLLNIFRKKTASIKNIKFIGQIKDKEKYYSEALVYYQPSLIESQGIAILEAMSYGLPIVASNIGGIPESVLDNVNGFLVNSTDVSETEDKIEKLLLSKSLRDKMGKQSKIIASNFSNKRWEDNIIDTLKLNE